MDDGSYKEQMFINYVKLQIFSSLQRFICEFAKKNPAPYKTCYKNFDLLLYSCCLISLSILPFPRDFYRNFHLLFHRTCEAFNSSDFG
jgi:hypothetical protein